jgi:hypothetical protein
MRAVYCEENFVFKKAVYAIKAGDKQKPFLKNLVGLFNSSLYAYLNLMTGSSLGIEREQRLFDEVLRFPYTFNCDIVTQVEQIQKITNTDEDFVAKNNATTEIDTLNQTIFEMFGLANNEFIDYALHIQIPQLTRTNDYDATRKVTVTDRRREQHY